MARNQQSVERNMNLARLDNGPPFGGMWLAFGMRPLCAGFSGEIKLDLRGLEEKEQRQLRRAFQTGYIVASAGTRAAVLYRHYCLVHGLPFRRMGIQHRNSCETTSDLCTRFFKQLRVDLQVIGSLVPESNPGARKMRSGSCGAWEYQSHSPEYGRLIEFHRPSGMTPEAFMENIGANIFPKPDETRLLNAMSDFVSNPMITIRMSNE